MMKKMKAVAAMLLSATMVFGLAACGSNQQTNTPATSESATTTESKVESETPVVEKKDPVTLEWYYRGNGVQKDSQMVEDRVNELLAEYPGLEHVTVHMNCYIGSEYQQAVTLAESAGEQIDILSTVSMTDWKQSVENGTFMALDDLLSTEMKETLPEWLWPLGSVDGKIYMIPTYQNAGNNGYGFIPKAYEKYFDADAFKTAVDAKDIQAVADVLAAYLEAVRAGEGTDTKWLRSLGIHLTQNTTQGFYYEEPFDVLSGNFILKNDSDKVEFRLTTDYAKTLYSIAADWYEKGYIHPDVTSITEKDFFHGNMMNPASYVFSTNGAIGDEAYNDATYSNNWGFDVKSFQIQNTFFAANNWSAGGQGIHSTCKNPEEAMAFLEALNTGTEKGKELYNTIVFGIEGTHYTKDAKDPERIETIEYTGSQGGTDTSYAALKWIIGNTFNAYKNQAVADGSNELTIAFNENPSNISSKISGFALKVDKVSTQLDQINAVVKEYSTTLNNGVMGADWTKTYDEFYAKLETAGLNDVLTEFQSQVDAFLSK